MSESDGLQKQEKTQHALKSGRIISLLIVTTVWKKSEESFQACRFSAPTQCYIMQALPSYIKDITTGWLIW